MPVSTPVADAYSAAYETNPLNYDHSAVAQDRLTLAEIAQAGGRIRRLRMFFEGRIADLSYCHAVLPDGSLHSVDTSNLSLGSPRTVKHDLIVWAQREGVYAKGLGLLDESTWSVLR